MEAHELCFTYHANANANANANGQQVQSRLDLIYVSSSRANLKFDWKILPRYRLTTGSGYKVCAVEDAPTLEVKMHYPLPLQGKESLLDAVVGRWMKL